jgi:hypothetical protein
MLPTKEDNNKKVATDFSKHPENIKMHWSKAYSLLQNISFKHGIKNNDICKFRL